MDPDPLELQTSPEPPEYRESDLPIVCDTAAAPTDNLHAEPQPKVVSAKKSRKKTPAILRAIPSMDCSVPVEPRLPLARVKAFMKLDPRVDKISADALYSVTKATV